MLSVSAGLALFGRFLINSGLLVGFSSWGVLSFFWSSFGRYLVDVWSLVGRFFLIWEVRAKSQP